MAEPGSESLPDVPAPAAAGRAVRLVPGSGPLRRPGGGESGLGPAETKQLEGEAAAAGRRMGANQLVVLNVYDMVSTAPAAGARPRPASSRRSARTRPHALPASRRCLPLGSLVWGEGSIIF